MVDDASNVADVPIAVGVWAIREVSECRVQARWVECRTSTPLVMPLCLLKRQLEGRWLESSPLVCIAVARFVHRIVGRFEVSLMRLGEQIGHVRSVGRLSCEASSPDGIFVTAARLPAGGPFVQIRLSDRPTFDWSGNL